jgi:oligoendopeptidase F
MGSIGKASGIPGDELGTMPEWDLSDLYPAPGSAELEADLKTAGDLAEDIQRRCQGRLADMSGEEFGRAIVDYERLSELIGRLLSYAQLLYAANVSDPERGRFYQDLQERVTDLSTKTVFFTLEINRLDEATLAAKLASPAVAHYRPWLRDLRVFRDHQLPDDLEQLLHEREVVGRSAWVRLFDETMAELRFPVGGEQLTSAQTLHLLSDKNPDKRKSAAAALGTVLGQNIRVFSLITNTLIKEKEIDDKWRCYPRATSYRNLSNQVEDEVVDALVQAVQDSYGLLSHRYYRLKAKWFGVEQLDHWDRNAPLPEDDDRRRRWDEAKDIVLDAYRAFSPELADIGARFFADGWIDAPARPGKSPGAFAHPTVPSAHPYLLLNFLGKTRDVMTVAHELGHGVHQVLAAGQGQLMAGAPLTLAETASVFGEMLTFRALLDSERDPARRRVMLASKVEDMLNTVVRQVAFYEFERQIHQERRKGELASGRIGEIWLDIQRQSLGPAMRFDADYQHYWAYIPHFVHSPFYVYAYAFGDCLVNSLYDAYRAGQPGFERKYIEMLRAGGTLRHKELLAPFGLDASDPAFWRRGLGIVAGFIDELEALS